MERESTCEDRLCECEKQNGKENTGMSHQVIINHFAWKKIQILHCRAENKEYSHAHKNSA